MLSVVIQAGGESRRMGREKGLVRFLGQPLVERMAVRLRALADELLVTTNRPEAYAFLNLPLFPDLIPGRGALGGLYTALNAARGDLIAVVACDMPFANPDLLAYGRDLLAEPAIDAVIPCESGGTEPFHALYRRETCLPEVAAALAAEHWKVNAWFDRVNIHYLQPEEYRRFDPHGLAFQNVNTPEELAIAEEQAIRLGERAI